MEEGVRKGKFKYVKLEEWKDVMIEEFKYVRLTERM